MLIKKDPTQFFFVGQHVSASVRFQGNKLLWVPTVKLLQLCQDTSLSSVILIDRRFFLQMAAYNRD